MILFFIPIVVIFVVLPAFVVIVEVGILKDVVVGIVVFKIIVVEIVAQRRRAGGIVAAVRIAPRVVGGAQAA
ncbi:MAG: hypothetical protein GX614_04055 [Sandaracinaceae bacterium]|nr:hypothetical protein [Sandaracinaceae bacterium]